MQTPEGTKKQVKTIKEKYGEDFFSKIGAIGGKKGKTGGFGAGEAGRERARIAGQRGGRATKKDYR